MRPMRCGAWRRVPRSMSCLPTSTSPAAWTERHWRAARANCGPDLPVLYTSGRRSQFGRLQPVEGSMFVPKPYDPFKIGRLLDYLVETTRASVMLRQVVGA